MGQLPSASVGLSGPAVQAIYLHFNSKADLLVATFQYADEQAGTLELLRPIFEAATALEALDAGVTAYAAIESPIFMILRAPVTPYGTLMRLPKLLGKTGCPFAGETSGESQSASRKKGFLQRGGPSMRQRTLRGSFFLSTYTSTLSSSETGPLSDSSTTCGQYYIAPL